MIGAHFVAGAVGVRYVGTGQGGSSYFFRTRVLWILRFLDAAQVKTAFSLGRLLWCLPQRKIIASMKVFPKSKSDAPQFTDVPDMKSSHLSGAFAAVVQARRSIRAFLPEPVAPELLETIITSARRAPSGANLQPGTFLQIKGAVREQLSNSLLQAFRSGLTETEDYSYFPDPMPTELRRRQVAAARALYGAVGIERDDRSGRGQQFERNFCFFDAPVALVVTIARDMGTGCYMDLGMALYGLMLAAQAHGLASCGIGALASYPTLIRRELGLQDNDAIVCGLALGYADPDAAVNQAETTRAGLDSFFRVIG
jgi:nitroreductase